MHLHRTRRLPETLSVSVVILAAGALSFAMLNRLAVAVGWPPYLAWLFPVTIDLYALLATNLWLATPGPSPARRRAAQNAVGAIVLSVAGNTAQHLAQAHVVAIGWVTTVLVSAVPPTVMALTVHLAVQLSGTSLPDATGEEVPAEPQPTPCPPPSGTTIDEPAAMPEPQAADELAPARGWHQLDEDAKLAAARSAVEALENDGVAVTGTSLGALLGVTSRTGRNYLRKLQEAPEALAG